MKKGLRTINNAGIPRAQRNAAVKTRGVKKGTKMVDGWGMR